MPETPAPRTLVHRTTARVLPMRADGRVLLLHGWEPRNPSRTFWFTVGGAVEAGEDLQAAGARELAEETGFVVSPGELIGPIGQHENEFDWGEWHIVQSETFFGVRVDGTPDLSGLEALERGTIDRTGWWTDEELIADGTAANDLLPAMLATARRLLR